MVRRSPFLAGLAHHVEPNFPLLWGIGSDPNLGVHRAFKGGTSLKKCYVETWRFSEDLDFTIIPGGPDKPETIEPIIKRILARVHDESGIDFPMKPPVFKHADKYLYTEGSIYYRGPHNAPSPEKVKLDISGFREDCVANRIERNSILIAIRYLSLRKCVVMPLRRFLPKSYALAGMDYLGARIERPVGQGQ